MKQTLFSALMLAILGVITGNASAEPNRGFNVVVAASPTGEERSRQRGIWDLEVGLKSMRMIEVGVKQADGKIEKELIWYLPYRIVQRPIEQIVKNEATTPVNNYDKQPVAIFAPEIFLVTDEKTGQKIHPDVIIPEALQAIQKRENRAYLEPIKYLSSVEIVGPLPALTPPEKNRPNARYGVAMWRDVDLRVDSFTVFMGGFSNGYIKGQDVDGKPLVLRKTLMQRFSRLGDKYDPTEREIRAADAPKWVYRPEGKISLKAGPGISVE